MTSAAIVGALLAVAVALAPIRAGVSGPEHRATSRGRLGPRLAVIRRLRHPSRSTGDQASSSQQVAAALTLLALAYRSGLPTWDVLLAVASDLRDPVARDLRQVAAALRWGAEDSEAWGSVGPVWGPAARAVAVAHQAGVPPGPILLAAADDLRRADLERLEVAAAKVGVRLVAPLGLVLLPAFCLTTVVPLVVALAGRLIAA
jgi:pilus assembly protein TadC